MSYLAKMMLGAWIGMAIAFVCLDLMPTLWMKALSVTVLFLAFYVFTKGQSPEKRAHNLAVSAQYWDKPIWKRILLGIVIFTPPFALAMSLSDFMSDGDASPIKNLLIAIFLGTWMGFVFGWVHKRKHLTAQSDKTNTA